MVVETSDGADGSLCGKELVEGGVKGVLAEGVCELALGGCVSGVGKMRLRS